MRVEHKQIKIAEYLGWMDIYRCGASFKRSVNGEIHGKYYVGTLDKPSINYSRTYRQIPRYFQDLNACYEMEQALTTPDQVVSYLEWLGMCDSDYGYKVWRYAHASAAERAEAFGRTFNLW